VPRFAFNFTGVLYRGIVQFGRLDWASGTSLWPEFVISGFCSVHFTVTLAGLKNIVRYTEDFVIKVFDISGFTVQCTEFILADNWNPTCGLLHAVLDWVAAAGKGYTGHDVFARGIWAREAFIKASGDSGLREITF